MWPHAAQASRSRSSPSTGAELQRVPQREQKLSVAASHDGTPPPEAMSVERPSGPRSKERRSSPPRSRAHATSTTALAASEGGEADER